MTSRFVRIPVAASLTGYTQKAIRRKIEDGVWRAGVEYVRAPDGNILIDMQAFEKWVQGAKFV